MLCIPEIFLIYWFDAQETLIIIIIIIIIIINVENRLFPQYFCVSSDTSLLNLNNILQYYFFTVSLKSLFHFFKQNKFYIMPELLKDSYLVNSIF